MKKLFLSITLLCLLNACSAQPGTSDILEFKAFNGIRFEYSLFLPKTLSKDKKHTLIAVLCETHIDDAAWSATAARLKELDLEQAVVVLPKVPLGHDSWGTHPIHHAFNDLLKSVRKIYGTPSQKFHLLGIEAGQEVAFWWTYGSSNLISSTSIINGTLWNQKHWDEKWYRNLTSSRVPIYAYERETPTKFDMSKIQFSAEASLEGVIGEIVVRD